MVRRQCPLLPGGRLWDQEDDEVLPLASSLHQVSHPPPPFLPANSIVAHEIPTNRSIFLYQRIQCGGWCDQRNHQLRIPQPLWVSWVFLAIMTCQRRMKHRGAYVMLIGYEWIWVG